MLSFTSSNFVFQISNSIEADELIDCQEFQQALGIENDELARRIFAVFDEDGDGTITFIVRIPLFLCTLKRHSPASAIFFRSF